MNRRAALRLPDESGKHQTFVLRERTVIGRTADCDIALDHKPLSRHHARIDLDGERWILTDLESANGTFLNGERVSAARPLRSGDRLQLGRLEFDFLEGYVTPNYAAQNFGAQRPGLALTAVAAVALILLWAVLRPHLGLAGRSGRSISVVIGDVLIEATLVPTLTPSAPLDLLGNSEAPVGPAPTPTSAPPPNTAGRLAFTSDRDGNAEVYLIGGDGANLIRVTNNLAADQNIAWLDADALAIVSNRAGERNYYQLSLSSPDTVTLLNLPGTDIDLAWSPNGSQMAYVRTFLNDSEVYVSAPGGEGGFNLSQSPAADRQPAWSPDGRQLAFVSWRDGDEFGGQLYLVNADGTDLRRITPLEMSANGPKWSPDGKRLVFPGTPTGSGRVDIYVISADGVGLTNLTAGHEGQGAGGAVNIPNVSNLSPAWSPFGGRIAFQSNRDGNWEIYTIRSDGNDLRRITADGGADVNPLWQP